MMRHYRLAVKKIISLLTLSIISSQAQDTSGTLYDIYRSFGVQIGSASGDSIEGTSVQADVKYLLGDSNFVGSVGLNYTDVSDLAGQEARLQ